MATRNIWNRISAPVLRSTLRDFSTRCVSETAASSQRGAIIRGAHYPVSMNKQASFSQDVRWLGTRSDSLTRSKVNGSGGKKSTWTCPKCGSVNGAHHQRCMGCQDPDSVAIGRSSTFGFSLGADSQNTSKVALPRSIIKFCVNRSPHIDKKSREQFEMRVSKLYMVVKTRAEDIQKKLFWLKRQRILGAQYEIIFSYKTRLPLQAPSSDNP